VLIDDRPAYLSGSPPLSLLLLPLGAGTVLGRLRAEVVRHARHRIVVVTRFEPDPDYFAALAALGIRGEDVHSEAAFAQQLGRYEPSDCLLIRDSRRLGAQLLDLGGILADGPVSSRSSRHLVWHAGTSAGTNERILVDASGRVSRIQRYYENVTWPFASGVACSLVPVASVWSLPKLAATRLVELRASLSAAGVQSTDSHLEVSLFDLGTEAGLLAANEASISASTVSSPPASATIDPTALVRGAVLVGENVVVESRALVIGPCVLADGSRVGHGAVVAQCVLTTGASVLPGEVARQRLVIEGRPARSAEVGDFVPLDAFDPTASGELDQELRLPVGFALQRAVEAALSLVALLVLFPLMAFLALLVKLESRGPAFFSHLREGRFGRTFRCWKFRTMQVNADVVQHELEETNQVDGPQFKIHRDPRVTRVGLWLRRLNLDETPQLFNVLKGEMSLVGPRPSPFRENQLCIPWREARLSVRPGITGLWQVCRNDRSSGDFHQWIYYDLLYVEHMSWWLDLKILVATVTSLGGHFPVPLSRLLPPAKFHDRRGASRPAETSAEVRARRMLLDRRERVELLGCEFDPCNLQSAIDRCIEWCRGPRLSHTVITLNAALLCQMRRDAELRQACRRGDLILADGNYRARRDAKLISIAPVAPAAPPPALHSPAPASMALR
jgi:lipopolysaccharide/colanic/teichoic acid biosynthesis glycosyltransferase